MVEVFITLHTKGALQRNITVILARSLKTTLLTHQRFHRAVVSVVVSEVCMSAFQCACVSKDVFAFGVLLQNKCAED